MSLLAEDIVGLVLVAFPCLIAAAVLLPVIFIRFIRGDFREDKEKGQEQSDENRN